MANTIRVNDTVTIRSGYGDTTEYRVLHISKRDGVYLSEPRMLKGVEDMAGLSQFVIAGGHIMSPSTIRTRIVAINGLPIGNSAA
jgi:hypothetical protein